MNPPYEKVRVRELSHDEHVQWFGPQTLPKDGQQRYVVELSDPQHPNSDRILVLKKTPSGQRILIQEAFRSELPYSRDFYLTEAEIQAHHAYLWSQALPVREEALYG